LIKINFLGLFPSPFKSGSWVPPVRVSNAVIIVATLSTNRMDKFMFWSALCLVFSLFPTFEIVRVVSVTSLSLLASRVNSDYSSYSFVVVSLPNCQLANLILFARSLLSYVLTILEVSSAFASPAGDWSSWVRINGSKSEFCSISLAPSNNCADQKTLYFHHIFSNI